MTIRERMIDDRRQMEDCLIWIEENKDTVSTWGVLRAMCRTLYHLIGWVLYKMDQERGQS